VGFLLKWVVDFDVHGNIVKKSDGLACSTDAPENVEQVTALMQQSPSCSARQHVITSRILSKSIKTFLQRLQVPVLNSSN
jgi:hypothetical protein